MRRLLVYFWIGFVLITQYQVGCDENIQLMFRKFETIDEDIVDIRGGMARMEEKIVDKIDFFKASLRSELKMYIKELVKESMAEIVQGETIEELVRSQVLLEVRQLRRGQHQMKRQLFQVMKSLRDFQEERNLYKEALSKTERNASELKTCSKYVEEAKLLQREKQQCHQKITENERINGTYQIRKEILEQCHQQTTEKDEEIRELKHRLSALNTMYQMKTRNAECVPETTDKLEEETTTDKPEEETTTTTKPEEKRSRIIVAPYWSGTRHQFRQLNIHNNTVNNYPYLNPKFVFSLAYVSKLRKVLIGVGVPYRILSSTLDSYGVKTVREGVEIRDMAVDEDRELVFIATHSPFKGVSRMTTHGENFTVAAINLSTYKWPYGVAINPEKQLIYTSHVDKVLMISYDGRVLQTLATGNSMYALTLDTTGSTLYYGNNKKLMELSLSQNVSRKVTTFSRSMWNLRFHNRNIYATTVSRSTVDIVRLEYEPVSYTLQTNTFEGASQSVICLVP